jgi:hypothetical protein
MLLQTMLDVLNVRTPYSGSGSPSRTHRARRVTLPITAYSMSIVTTLRAQCTQYIATRRTEFGINLPYQHVDEAHCRPLHAAHASPGAMASGKGCCADMLHKSHASVIKHRLTFSRPGNALQDRTPLHAALNYTLDQLCIAQDRFMCEHHSLQLQGGSAGS